MTFLSLHLCDVEPLLLINDSWYSPIQSIETDYGLINVRITALTTTMIISGSYTTDITPNEIKLALNVCTYHRPEYIEKKKETFQKAIEQYDLPDDTEMFIIDNASELDVELDDPRIHIFHNPNTGGSGGISRGIQEICSNKEVTHIILMDDDTIVEPECLFRTWSFLSCLKKEYEDSAIAGTMLLMEKPNTIYESGTVFEDPGDGIPRCRSLKHMLNVSDDEGCLTFDREEKIDYNGWWFCVYPTSFANPNNLPMRLFIRYDDVEYGLRFGKQFITLNGISTWHSNFNKNNNPITLYYSIRNHLILLRKTGINVKKYEKKKIKDALSLVKRGDCASASAIKDAIQDSKHFDPNNNDGIVSLQTYGRIRLAIMLLLRLFG